MTSSRPPRAYSLSQSRSDGLHDSQDDIRELPRTFLSPDSSKPDSLKPNSVQSDSPSHRVLFAYRHVLFLCRKSAVSLSSLIRNKANPEPVDKPVTEPNTQPKSVMSLKLDRLKDKWCGVKNRTSPAAFRCAGYIFLVLVLIVAASMIIGWYGLSKEIIAHQSVTVTPTQMSATVIDYNESFQPGQTPTLDQLLTIYREDPTTLAHHLLAKNPDPTATSDETSDVTVVKTVIVTVTSVITDTAMKTLTTTVFLSTCTTCITTSSTPTASGNAETIASQDAAVSSVMTSIMYCSFTGRRNIYTLCPLVHTNSPAMLTDTPVAVSSGTPRMKNSFTAVRIALVSLWNSLPSLGRLMQRQESGRCGCDCTGMKKKLDAAVDLVRVQQRLLESQQAVINEHRKGLYVVLETLVNATAARAGDKKKTGDVPLDLNI
ncbi:hypothetical protein F4678DRAFT_434977 [Xylaria arbuscula]|nr:hypothetical protein F4678DRAFT_434977 [Xylaria arbuscula]